MQIITDYFTNNPDAIWYVLGGLMLVVEAKILGLSTGVLLFTGIGAMLTGFAVSMEWVTATETQIITFGISSVIVAGLLWKPFKALQKGGNTIDQSSDMIGLVVELEKTVSRTEPGLVRWSGIDWKVSLDSTCPVDVIEAGQQAKVTTVSAGKMTVTVE